MASVASVENPNMMKANMAKIKDMGLAFHDFVGSIGNSREISLAKTKIEEAVMWAVKHITA